jgi:hypothetical protein
MNISMEDIEGLTIPEMERFLESNRRLRFNLPVEQAYPLIGRILERHRYGKLSKRERGIVQRFLRKVTNRSRPQMNRLIGRWKKTRKVERLPARRPRFGRRYGRSDIALLVETDKAHQDLSGPAVRRLFERAYQVYGEESYERLAGISVSHIYNLRRSAAYRDQRVILKPTQPRYIAIGERSKPEPENQPGFLRLDTVHQGQRDGAHGIYHINSVDTVTQWEIVGCVETISERYMIPVLEAMLHQFPFTIMGFHCDNGSEFINHTVAKLLNKLLIEFTKSRPSRTTDNAQVEGKNGAIVRKHIGYGHIPADCAMQFQKFYTAHFNPYLNYHRPCGFATVQKGPRGKRRRVYKVEDYRTPFEQLTSLADWERFLKPGISSDFLTQQALRRTDLEAARQMQKAKDALLRKCRLLLEDPRP